MVCLVLLGLAMMASVGFGIWRLAADGPGFGPSARGGFYEMHGRGMMWPGMMGFGFGPLGTLFPLGLIALAVYAIWGRGYRLHRDDWPVCPVCHRGARPDWRACPYCGTALNRTAAPAAQPAPQPSQPTTPPKEATDPGKE